MRKLYFLLGLLTVALLISCKENTLKPSVQDNVAPGKVEIVSVTPINGGLKIQYKLPADNDLLYVKAEYDLVGGVKGVVSVSYFDNTITVLGFGDTSERTIRLYAVDRSGNVSLPTEFKGTPLVSPVKLIQDSLNIAADFGGAKFTWVNRTGAPIAIQIFAEDSITHKLKLVNTIYTSQIVAKYSVRNLPSRPTAFAALVRDRWDNVSDTIRPAAGKLTPMLEQRLDKTKMQKVILASDTKWDAWGFKYENLFDDNLTTTGHTQGDHPWPQIFTIDLGVKASLSRFRAYRRGPSNTGWLYGHGNPKRYDVYGAVTLPANPDDLSQWQKLRDQCVSVKPSGAGAAVTNEDITYALNGDEFDFDQVANPSQIRYFRLVVWETWDGAGYVDFQELTWWGKIIN